MRWLLFFVLLLMCFSGFAQKKDTIYYNKYWNKSKKKNAEYYRPVPLKKENNLYKLLILGGSELNFFGGRKDSFIEIDALFGKELFITDWFYENAHKTC